MENEEGQKNIDKAQFFDSSDIGKKQKAEQFTIVEGAEQRAREAKKEARAEAHELEKIHEEDIREQIAQNEKNKKAAEAEKQKMLAQMNPQAQPKKLSKKTLCVIISAILLLAIAVIVGIFIYKNSQKTEPEREPQSYSIEIYEQAVAALEATPGAMDYYAGEEVIANAIDGAKNDSERAYLTLQKAKYYAYMKVEIGEAEKLLESAKEYDENVAKNCDYLNVSSYVYMFNDELEKFNEVQNEEEALSCE